MRTVYQISASAALIVLLVACGASVKEKKGDLNDKKAELQKLKAEQSRIGADIQKLEDEIARLDPASATVKAKLVATTPIEKQKFTHYIDLQGRITTDNIYYVTPRGMGGQVTAIYAKEGQPVRKGQLLIKLDDALMRQQIEQARIQLSHLKDLYQRRKNLWDQSIGTEVELLNAENAVKNAEKQIALLQEQLQMTNVTAEVSGIVEKVNIRVGETLSPASAAQAGISIVNKSDLKVAVDIPENYLGKVNRGTNVVVEVPDVNKQFNSTITLVSQLIDPSSRSFSAEAKLPNDKALQPNQIALVKLQDYAAKDVVVVPLNTIQTDEKGKYVYVLADENGKKTARKKPVQIGQIYGEKIEIREGLADGDQLISQGFQDLYEGQPVTTDSK